LQKHQSIVSDVRVDAQESISIADGSRQFEQQDITSTLAVLSEEMNELKISQANSLENVDSRPLSNSTVGSADYNASTGTVAVEIPVRRGSTGGQLSMAAQNSIRKLKEQVKSGMVFGQLINSTMTTSSLELLIKSFQDRVDSNLLNPSLRSLRYIRESDIDDRSLTGWHNYDIEKEFKRQQVNDKWAAYRLNTSYELCSSYPHILYMPANLKVETIQKCADFRSKSRLPVLSWFNNSHGNFMMRSAQPKTGAMRKFSVDDENLIEAARLCLPQSSTLVIFDARSQVAAEGNKLKGMGTENMLRYSNCRLLHLDIGNIHAMRESIDKLRSAVCERTTELHWLSTLEDTQWLNHVASVLTGATTLARCVAEKGAGVLVHCSDGWDRTSQLTSLSQLMLDPYYRTYQGFKVLVEKEWLSFGHKFADRLGNLHYPNERSPVFLQFLDCTWQIMQQFPTAFEFSGQYILTIAEHHSSGWFGTFLMNTEKDRASQCVMAKSVSLWSHLDAIKRTLINQSYSPVTEILKPLTSVRRLRLWNDYFLRYDESAWDNSAIGDLMEGGDDSSRGQQQKMNVVVWVPDKRAKVCYDCKLRFTQLRRRVSMHDVSY
jgi:hypothetical protein